MKKLYHATMVVDVVFAHEIKACLNNQFLPILNNKARDYLRMEMTNGISLKNIDVIEIPNTAHIPKEWSGCFIYGVEENVTAEEFLESQNEYEEYLRLKAKFESV